MSNWLSETKQIEIFELIGKGFSIRQIAKELGISKVTVGKRSRFIRTSLDMRDGGVCGCGKEGGHNGWCSYRFKSSPARQKFMQRWHNPNPSPQLTKRG